ncbi:MAG: hypothetical protein IPI91_02450 [Flavobacteriales bacterium]|nr:hypothetical protein [Flavobacteriales bacterium]
MKIYKWSLVMAITALFTACGSEPPPQEALKVDNAIDSSAQRSGKEDQEHLL